MVDHALETLSRYILYRAQSDPDDGSRRESLLQKRADLLAKLEEFAVGTQSNAVEAVRRSVSMGPTCKLQMWKASCLT